MVWDKGQRGHLGTPTTGIQVHCKSFGCWHVWKVSAAELAAMYPSETVCDHMEFRCEKCARVFNVWGWDWASDSKNSA